MKDLKSLNIILADYGVQYPRDFKNEVCDTPYGVITVTKDNKKDRYVFSKTESPYGLFTFAKDV